MTQEFRLLASAAILSAALIASPFGLAFAEKAHAASTGDQATATPHWTYEGEDGPAAWGKLHGLDGAAYPVCATGDGQSPIDLYATNATGSIAIETDYKTGPLILPENGHTIQVKAPVDSSITIGGVRYNLLQVHFHTPSEHVINGASYPMEAHFVHQHPDTQQLAVLGVLIKQGRSNWQLEQILREKKGDNFDGKIGRMTFDPNALLPKDLKVFRYDGSLTTPPCSEGVNWNVAAEPIEASADELAVFRQYMGANARPAQPLNARPLVKPE